jgi:copper resistance protein C
VRSTDLRRPGKGFPAATAVGIAVASLAAAVAVAGPASAHASLTSSKPADGATVTEAPAQVELTFSEEIRSPSTIVVTGPDGTHVQQGPVRIANSTATLALGQITAPGRYIVAYRVVSDDGHPVSGELSFTFAPKTRDAATAEATAAAAGSGSPGRPSSGGQSAVDGHGAHLVALGILVAAALVASFIAFKKDREYDQTPTDPGTAATGGRIGRSADQRPRGRNP